MADLHNLLGDIQSDDEAPPVTIDNELDEPWDRNDRERLDLPPALQEAERKRYETVEEEILEEEEDFLEEDNEYAQLKRLWKLEMNCPDLMPFDAETIGLQLELLEGQDEIIEKLSARFDPQLAPLMGSIYKMDADRVRFILTDLMRTRLAKIEEHPLYMRDMVDRMSNDEVRLCILENRM
jgi:GINS complex subunit 4